MWAAAPAWGPFMFSMFFAIFGQAKARTAFIPDPAHRVLLRGQHTSLLGTPYTEGLRQHNTDFSHTSHQENGGGAVSVGGQHPTNLPKISVAINARLQQPSCHSSCGSHITERADKQAIKPINGFTSSSGMQWFHGPTYRTRQIGASRTSSGFSFLLPYSHLGGARRLSNFQSSSGLTIAIISVGSAIAVSLLFCAIVGCLLHFSKPKMQNPALAPLTRLSGLATLSQTSTFGANGLDHRRSLVPEASEASTQSKYSAGSVHPPEKQRSIAQVRFSPSMVHPIMPPPDAYRQGLSSPKCPRFASFVKDDRASTRQLRYASAPSHPQDGTSLVPSSSRYSRLSQDGVPSSGLSNHATAAACVTHPDGSSPTQSRYSPASGALSQSQLDLRSSLRSSSTCSVPVHRPPIRELEPAEDLLLQAVVQAQTSNSSRDLSPASPLVARLISLDLPRSKRLTKAHSLEGVPRQGSLLQTQGSASWMADYLATQRVQEGGKPLPVRRSRTVGSHLERITSLTRVSVDND